MQARLVAILGLAFCLSTLTAPAQDKPKEETKTDAKGETKTETSDASTALKVQIVIAESLGEKKLSSVPSTIYLEAYEHNSPPASIRTEEVYSFCCAKDGNQWHYNTNSNMDIRARRLADGRFDVRLSLIRSWWEWNGTTIGEGRPGTMIGAPERHEEPTRREVSTEFNLLMRDGQSLPGFTSADPWTGKVFSVTVALSVVK